MHCTDESLLVHSQGKEVMHAFINQLREEGVDYIAPWRPTPQIDAPAANDETNSFPEQAAPAEGAVGYDLATTSSDFGSMCLEEAVNLERASKCTHILQAWFRGFNIGKYEVLIELRITFALRK